MARGHAEALIPMIVDMMADAGKSLVDVDVVGVTVGPGSFTGIRTGIAAARGFAKAADAVAVGVSALAAVAHRAFRETDPAMPVLCVLDTRRRDYFVQGFDADETPLFDPVVMDADAVCARLSDRPFRLAGNAVARFAAERPAETATVAVAPGNGLPRAADIARIAARRADENLLEQGPSPLYLRAAEAKRPADGGRLIR